MSSMQKKRKNTQKSSQRDGYGDGRKSRGSSLNYDTDEDKLHKKKAQGEGGNGCLNRVLLVFVTAVCFLFYDAVNVNKSIYSHVFVVSSNSIVEEATKDSIKKFETHVLDGIEDESNNLEIMLASAGSLSDSVNMDVEMENVRRMLGHRMLNTNTSSGTGKNATASAKASINGGDEDGGEDEDGEDGKSLSGSSSALFRDKNELLAALQENEEKIKKRMGKSVFAVSKSGYDLTQNTLDFGAKIHGDNKLEDWVQIAIDRAKMLAEQEEKDMKKSKGEDDSSKTKAKVDKAQQELENQADTLNRKMAFEQREPPPAFVKFVKFIRTDNTYAHLGKRNDMERALKGLGYKQSTKGTRKEPLWFGWEEKGKCPAFKKDLTRISFCPFYIPQNKADQYAFMKSFASQVPKAKQKPDFYPLTWRLYKEAERKSLKLHCTNESMSEFGVAYVRKFTVPGSNYMKSADSIYEQLQKSDKSVKQLTKETKNRAIVQLYVNNPFLIEERKFIIRTFAVIVNAKPFIVYYHDGAVYRSIVKYSPFTRHDSDYKKAAHITSEQKSAKAKVLKSSELYASFGNLQYHLTKAGKEPTYVNDVLRPKMKAIMIYSLYAILRRQQPVDEDGEVTGATLPRNSAVIQTSCFDFLMDENYKLWLLNIATGPHCFISLGGNSFRPQWKVKIQDALSETTAKLGEEVLWRRMNRKPMSSMTFFTQSPTMPVLIDETFPDWDMEEEINTHLEGRKPAQDNVNYEVQKEDEEESEPADKAALRGGHSEGSGESESHDNDDEEGEEEDDGNDGGAEDEDDD